MRKTHFNQTFSKNELGNQIKIKNKNKDKDKDKDRGVYNIYGASYRLDKIKNEVGTFRVPMKYDQNKDGGNY